MRQRWEDWVTLVSGAWLIVSPWVFVYTAAAGAATNSYLVGIAVIVFAIWALSAPRPWEEWINALIGAWLVVSPWVVGFSWLTAATVNNIIVGVILLVVSLEATRPVRQVGAHA